MSFSRGLFSRRSGMLVRLSTGILLTSISFVYAHANAAQVRFQDVTAQTNTSYTGESYGASWGDMDRDGWPDLFVNHHREHPSLYINNGDGTFEDRWRDVDIWRRYPFLDQHGGAWADFDNDGDQDLFVSLGATDNSQFLVSNGQTLSDKIVNYGFDRVQWSGRLPQWVDYTHDGYLDFTLANRGGLLQTLKQIPGRAPADSFARTNGVSGHQCDNNQFAQLADLTGDDEFELICAAQAPHPNKVYNTTRMPFIDVTNILPPVSVVADSVLGDFDNNLRNDMFLIRGAQRVSGAQIVGSRKIEAHLITDGAREKEFSFVSNGDLEMQIFWNARDPSDVRIGASGRRLGAQPGGGPLRASLSSSDPSVVGMLAHNPLQNNGVYIGYQPSTRTWTVKLSPGDHWNYAYFYINSTANISNLRTAGLTAGDKLAAPVLLLEQNGSYLDRSRNAGFTEKVHCISGVPGDFDNDMDLDIFMVCRGPVNNLVDRYYENVGNGTFRRMTNFGAEGPTGIGVGLGENVVVGDYDVDGALDLFVMNGLKLYPEDEYSDGGPDKMYRNQGNGNHWIELDLQGVRANRDGVGAKVYATAGGVTQYREQNGGYHRWAQDSQRIHFGLAGHNKVNIEVHWPKPSNRVDTFNNVSADGLYRVTEGGDIELQDLSSTGVPAPCGEPAYNKNTETALFIWKDCASGNWRVRATVAGSVKTYRGSIDSDKSFVSVNGVSLESNDTLDASSNPKMIDFVMSARDGGEDGFNFNPAQGADMCFSLDAPGGIPIYAGVVRKPLASPFNLSTLTACNTAPATPTLSIEDVSVAEDVAAGSVALEIALSAASTGTVSVQVVTLDGTATAPGDYTSTQRTISFTPGQTSKVFNIDINDDADVEGEQSFRVNLSNAVNAVVNDATAVVTILDDDQASADPRCGQPSYNKASEKAVFVWKDCSNNSWNARLTAGGTSVTYRGQVTSDQNFTGVTAVSIEGSDTLDSTTNQKIIDFTLMMSGSGQDGFAFKNANEPSACFMLDSPSGISVYVGAARTLVPASFNLASLAACDSDSGDLPQITISDVTASENAGVVTFTLDLSQASDQTVTVSAATANGTATASEDYVTKQQTLSFAPGVTRATLNVTLVNDTAAEPSEQFLLNLSNPVNATLAVSIGTAAISDDDNAGGLTACSKPVYSRANEQGVFIWQDCPDGNWHVRMTAGGSPIVYRGSLSDDQNLVSFSGFSLESSDVLDNSTDRKVLNYQLAMGGSGEDGFNVTVLDEADACFYLDSPTGVPVYAGSARNRVTPPFDLRTLGPCGSGPSPTTPAISVADISVAENIAGGLAAFRVDLSAASNQTVSVRIATADGSANSGSDYVAKQQTLSFAPGQTRKTFNVSIINDSAVEGNQTFEINLSNPVNATLSNSSALATIVDDDTDSNISACGMPTYYKSIEQAVFVWQNCGTGLWSMRMTAGGSAVTYRGKLDSDQNLVSVTPFSIEGGDVLDVSTNPKQIDFVLSAGGAAQDGFDVQTGDADACFGINAPSSVPVYLGRDRVAMTGAFSLNTLSACTLP